jgi:type IX secretion system PorP/SprF family membrane protein
MSGKRNIVFTLILSTLCFINSFSQEQSIYINDYLNPSVINPACTGAEYYPVAHLSSKKQWLGFSGAPTTFLLSGNFRLGKYDFYDPKGFVNKGPLQLKDRVGIGAAIFQDNNGPLSNTGGILSYAYHVPVNRDSRLSFGMSAIMINYALKSSELKPDQMGDSYLLNGNNSIFTFNLGVGVYYHNNKYFTGISINKVLPGITDVNEPKDELPSFFVMGGYKFNRNSNSFNFEPSITLKKLGNEKLIADTHAKLYIKRLNWIAISYSTTQKMSFQFGLRIYKMAYIGYNFEYTLSNIATYNYGTHEISLGINLGLISVEGIRQSIRSSGK